ncbi:MAG: hypothetical protein RL394_574 [Bacteroidota bacterium]
MNSIKKYLGLVWIALAIYSYSILLKTAIERIRLVPTTDTIIQWSIFAIIFLPIALGFVMFGWMALKGAYDHLPESSNEVED